jgi:uncharacterized membrane protein
MLPSPLHPAIVHFPIVLVMLLPVAALAALWAIRRGARVSRAWAFPLVTAAALAGSAWLALETGETEEERVEEIAGEAPLETHEHAAERFLLLSGGVLLLMGAGFIKGRGGMVVRGVASTAALALVIAGYQVGHSGGRIVYGDGTSSGISNLSPGSPVSEAEASSSRSQDED